MLSGLRTIVYTVADLAEAKAWYTDILGAAPYFDEPFYVGFNVAGYELGLVPAGDTEAAGTSTTYWAVADVDAALSRLISAGSTTIQEPTDVGGGIRLASVRDPFGNVLGIIVNPHFGTDAHVSD